MLYLSLTDIRGNWLQEVGPISPGTRKGCHYISASQTYLDLLSGFWRKLGPPGNASWWGISGKAIKQDTGGMLLH